MLPHRCNKLQHAALCAAVTAAAERRTAVGLWVTAQSCTFSITSGSALGPSSRSHTRTVSMYGTVRALAAPEPRSTCVCARAYARAMLRSELRLCCSTEWVSPVSVQTEEGRAQSLHRCGRPPRPLWCGEACLSQSAADWPADVRVRALVSVTVV